MKRRAMTNQLTDKQIERFNALYGDACELQKDLVILDGRPPKKPGISGAGKLKKSIQMFEEALKIHPVSWQSLYFIGKAYQALGNLESAMSWFMKAAKIEPDDSSIAKEAGVCAAKLGRHRMAIQLMSSAASAHPEDAALQCNMGLSYLMSRKVEEAMASFSRAVQADSGNQMNQKLLKLAESVAANKVQCPTSEEEILEFI
jgi:tetratricopeptide (TPR) repeat protein